MDKGKIRVAIVGLGNCASSLIQGINYYNPSRYTGRPIGLMHELIGGYGPSDIEIVAAYDIDRRKVGKSVEEAMFAAPNCTQIFCKDIAATGVAVAMGPVLDGYSAHMQNYADEQTFLLSDAAQPSEEDVIAQLRATKTEVLMNYLPVGSEQATQFYARCALGAGVAFVNNIPVFIASNPEWAARFKAKNVPIIGDDIKAQLGATITHRALVELFRMRGVELKRTYQLNTGGNTDFLNMLNRDRLLSKKTSKTEAVTSLNPNLAPNDVHVGPSDYVPWQNDNKLCFLRMEGELFGNVPMNIELRLSVEDSPNSAGVAIDSVRCAKLALERGEGGVIEGPSAFFCKHPPHQYTDTVACQMTEAFIQGQKVLKPEAEVV